MKAPLCVMHVAQNIGLMKVRGFVAAAKAPRTLCMRQRPDQTKVRPARVATLAALSEKNTITLKGRCWHWPCGGVKNHAARVAMARAMVAASVDSTAAGGIITSAAH
eukprot:7742487-Alexandrium_andersonii.AAC.1